MGKVNETVITIADMKLRKFTPEQIISVTDAPIDWLDSEAVIETLKVLEGAE